MRAIVDNLDLFASGFLLTFQLCLLAAVGSLLLGTVAAVLRISPLPPLRWVGTAYVTVFRNVPLTVVAFMVVFGLPHLGIRADFLRIPGLDVIFPRLGIELPYFRMAIFALALYTGAFVCEALRSGINAVPAGQAEAARALGLTFTQNLRYVVLPQAWKAAPRTSRSPLTTNWRRMSAGRGVSRTPSRISARTNRTPPTAWAATLAIAEPMRPNPAG